MDSHKRVLGILYICMGALQILLWLILSAIVATIVPFLLDRADQDAVEVIRWIYPIVRMIVGIFVAFIAVPSIIAGIGLLNHKPWALTMALILGCLKLFSFPLGTALGLYSIWVYVESTRKPVAA